MTDGWLEEAARGAPVCFVHALVVDGLDLAPKQRVEMAVNRPLRLESFRRAREAGIAIAAGGDISNRYPHGNNARELELLVREGLPPLEAIHTATGMAAREMRLDPRRSR